MDENGTPLRDEPPIFRPGDLEEGGLTIPVPTPTGAVPNPWKPSPNGGSETVPSSGQAKGPKT